MRGKGEACCRRTAPAGPRIPAMVQRRGRGSAAASGTSPYGPAGVRRRDAVAPPAFPDGETPVSGGYVVLLFFRRRIFVCRSNDREMHNEKRVFTLFSALSCFNICNYNMIAYFFKIPGCFFYRISVAGSISLTFGGDAV